MKTEHSKVYCFEPVAHISRVQRSDRSVLNCHKIALCCVLVTGALGRRHIVGPGSIAIAGLAAAVG